MRISFYDFGRIVVDGSTETKDVIIHPGGVETPWWRRAGHRLDISDLRSIWESEPRHLVIGTGYYGRMVVPEETLELVRAKGIEPIVAPTGEAVEMFNELEEKGEAGVVAAFHLTC